MDRPSVHFHPCPLLASESWASLKHRTQFSVRLVRLCARFQEDTTLLLLGSRGNNSAEGLGRWLGTGAQDCSQEDLSWSLGIRSGQPQTSCNSSSRGSQGLCPPPHSINVHTESISKLKPNLWNESMRCMPYPRATLSSIRKAQAKNNCSSGKNSRHTWKKN